MVVAEERQGQLFILDRIKEMVRLAAGLDDAGQLAPEVETRALDCLQRFGQRLRDLPSDNVSAVGTNTLRRTQNAGLFLQHAEEVLGHPIEIISGIEEARLIYQGVAHTLEPDQKRKLVIDIGGGSTELIIGEAFRPGMMESLEMGCVTMTQRFFADGCITPERIDQARVHVLQKMKAIRHTFRNSGWDVVIGASGTIRSAASVIQAVGLDNQDGISFEALAKIIQLLKQHEAMDSIKFAGLSEQREPVFVGGMIVLMGVFEALDIAHMQVSDGAVREGLLYDLLGRRHNQDVRNQSIESLAQRFHVDEQQGQRIEQTVINFFEQVCDDWALDCQKSRSLLLWASKVHEIGRDIAHTGFHKHSAYIIENTDLAGFSQQEQRRLATLVNVHRGKFDASSFEHLQKAGRKLILKLALLFRLSVILHRSRSQASLPELQIKVAKKSLVIHVPSNWLDEHPLTLKDLELESEVVANLGYSLSIATV